MNKLSRYAHALFSVAVLAACSATPADPVSVDERLADKGYQVGERVDRISNFRLNGWSYVDRQHVIITAGVSDRYLVSLKSTCQDLSHAINLAYTTTAGSLTDTDRLLVKVRGGFTHECLIHRLHKLEKGE